MFLYKTKFDPSLIQLAIQSFDSQLVYLWLMETALGTLQGSEEHRSYDNSIWPMDSQTFSAHDFSDEQ